MTNFIGRRGCESHCYDLLKPSVCFFLFCWKESHCPYKRGRKHNFPILGCALCCAVNVCFTARTTCKIQFCSNLPQQRSTPLGPVKWLTAACLGVISSLFFGGIFVTTERGASPTETWTQESIRVFFFLSLSLSPSWVLHLVKIYSHILQFLLFLTLQNTLKTFQTSKQFLIRNKDNLNSKIIQFLNDEFIYLPLVFATLMATDKWSIELDFD